MGEEESCRETDFKYCSVALAGDSVIKNWLVNGCCASAVGGMALDGI
jgi:hypothetical protein